MDDGDGDCTNDVQLGDGSNDGPLTFFAPVSNWTMTGRFDRDADNLIDDAEVAFTLQGRQEWEVIQALQIASDM